MRKVWEALLLFVIVFIFIAIIRDAITPFMPLIGIVAASLILLALAVLLGRAIVTRRKFW